MVVSRFAVRSCSLAQRAVEQRLPPRASAWLSALLCVAACERGSVQAEREAAVSKPALAPAATPASADEPARASSEEPARRGSEAGEPAARLGAATRLAAGDLDGDGVPELVVVDAASLRVVDPSGHQRAALPAPGAIQVLNVADIDHDGRAEILAGWGYGREHRDAPARASVLRLAGDALSEDTIMQPTTERAEIVQLLPRNEQLLVAHFDSKYMVSLAHARRGADAWELTPIERIRMADSLALGDLDHDGVEDLVIGRTYGDTLESDGDAFVLRPDGTRVAIPTVGGVRSLAVVDLDQDGRAELLLGDGWNRDYGHVARARLTLARWEADGFHTQRLDEGTDQYALWSLLAVDLERGGELEIVTRGNAQVQVLSKRDEGWQARRVGSVCRDVLALSLEDRVALWLACDDGVRVLRAQP